MEATGLPIKEEPAVVNMRLALYCLRTKVRLFAETRLRVKIGGLAGTSLKLWLISMSTELDFLIT